MVTVGDAAALADIRGQLRQLRDEIEGKPDTWDLDQLRRELNDTEDRISHLADRISEQEDNLDVPAGGLTQRAASRRANNRPHLPRKDRSWSSSPQDHGADTAP